MSMETLGRPYSLPSAQLRVLQAAHCDIPAHQSSRLAVRTPLSSSIPAEMLALLSVAASHSQHVLMQHPRAVSLWPTSLACSAVSGVASPPAQRSGWRSAPCLDGHSCWSMKTKGGTAQRTLEYASSSSRAHGLRRYQACAQTKQQHQQRGADRCAMARGLVERSWAGSSCSSSLGQERRTAFGARWPLLAA